MIDVIKVENPGTKKIVCEIKCDSLSEINRKIDQCHQQFEQMQSLTSCERIAILRTISSVIEKNIEVLADSLVEEVGKTKEEAKNELRASKKVYDWFANQTIPETVLTNTAKEVTVIRKPYGVIGLVIPWSFPMAVLAWKLAPSILHGNTAIIKSSPLAPLTIDKFINLISSVIPLNLVNHVKGYEDAVDILIDNEKVKMIALTGNTMTGINVLKKTANALKRTSLQLSGNDAAILMDDYCLDHIERLFWGIFSNAGQACYSIKRIYADKKIYSAFINKLFEYSKTINVGNGFDSKNQMGALINREQVSKMNQYVSEIKYKGGRVLVGGKYVDPNGHFFPPTIVYDLNLNCAIISEEQFGPIIPIIPINGIIEAIEEANKHGFGLGASIWTHNKEEAIQHMKKIDAAQAWINMHGDTEKSAPFGGLGKSGFEIEHGMNLFSYAQTLHVPLDT